ncbi:zinc finger protein OZF-like [Archocentrus centrarchus]|uniref:zinc finger protein OZF-like n=1 Tax=Archocentrus centrarchus TaxID=63155 RepID=UPI0011EA3D22|nr:zinc finger protein OZF-like [Archocentrus centrarchus]
MCIVQNLREFIKERLTAVCVEIFSEVQKTIGHYEEEISRHRRLLDISRKPDTNSHITDLPQLDDCEEEHSLNKQQISSWKRNSSLDQVDPEHPQIKEEQEELCWSQEGEQLGLKQEADGIWPDEERFRLLETIWKPEIKLHRIGLQQQHVFEEEIFKKQQFCNKERNSSLDEENTEPLQIKEEQEELCSSQEGEQVGQRQEADVFMVTLTYEDSDQSVAEPNSEDLLSHSAPEAEHQGHEESQHVDLGSTRNAEVKKRRHQRNRSHSQRVDSTPVSERQSETNTRKKSIQCDTCGKTFQHKSNLTRHLKSHTGDKPYSCSTCGKRFSDMSASIRHIKGHTEEKRFPCSTCEKRFKRKPDLERHIRTHTGEKPYPCITCGKRFGDVSAFIKHVRIHTRPKPYLCNICGKRFNQKIDLVYHIRSHTGEKPYCCSTCGTRFSQRADLKTHMRIHAG